MRALLLRAACLLALGCLPACSALGLADLPQSDCVNGGPGFCDSLAATSPTGDDCLTWQCNRAARFCEIQPRDDDDDDAPSMMCAPLGTTPDCDDADPHNFPGNTETCNGRDENCDGVADEGVITVTEAGTTTLAGDQHVVTTQPDADEAYVLGRTGLSLRRVVFGADGTPDAADVRLMGPTSVLSILDDGVAIAGIGSSTYATLLPRSETSGCRQLAMAPITMASPNATLRAADASLLPTCPSGAISAPTVSGRAGSPLLIGWLGEATAIRNCGSAPAVSVVLGTGQFDARATGNRIGAATVTLGQTVDVGPLAALPIAAAAGTSAFLVAYPMADGTVAVHRITISALLEIADGGVIYTEPAGSGAMLRQGVGLALGPTAGVDTTVALSFFEGCGGANAISVRWLTLSGATLTASGLTTGIGTGVARSLVQVVYQPRSTDWLVGWRSSAGLGVQRVFDDGALEGEPIDVLAAAGLNAFALQARSAGPLFQATAVEGAANVHALTFGCAAP